ncbi:MAG: 23S rRNA (uracil(1939)-C(5))-methyltransferase RlmD [SAR324 cluster bacterium]|nr:23S rRNA (uracil(1939)-C(5))-methyltransferase RlmD [SAR324 cluster bacterium]
MKLRGKTIECEIEKLVNGGFGLSRYNKKVIFVHNALPGERVEALVTTDKRDYAKAVATQVLTPSSFRHEPMEDHFLSCSPWQVIDYEQENFWKQEITEEVFLSIAGLDFTGLKMVADEQRFHYRSKMEFSFLKNDQKISLAFFKRGQNRKEAISDCVLAHSSINEGALRVVEEMDRYGIPQFSLKTMILRSNRAGEIVIALFVKDEQFPLLEGITLDEKLKGFAVHFSDPQSPASISTKILHQQGDDHLTETVMNKPLQYGPMSFFQVNLNLFENALLPIKSFVAGEDILDYYCGVGAIGIAVSDVVRSCIMVDISEDSIFYARKNIELNQLAHYSVFCSKAEKILEHILPDKVIIIDPPRAGIHPKVLRALREKQPKRIVYLSCNIATCARDLAQLTREYEIVFKEVYNFFPATPHIEFLTVLDRKKQDL